MNYIELIGYAGSALIGNFSNDEKYLLFKKNKLDRGFNICRFIF